MKKFFMKSDVLMLKQMKRNDESNAERVVYGALLGTIGAILQSSGMFGGIGLLISALSSFPIVLATLRSLRTGFLTYLVTFALLSMIQPAEAYVYLITTGLLGLSMGFGFRVLKKEWLVVLFSATALMLGILFLLLVIEFPVLGPSIGGELDLRLVLYIFLFTMIYSFIWMKSILIIMKKYAAIVDK
ncbi:hypothetical protein GH741_02015 [Aquibacillus halophilus]|uniref:DUF2232 domain-containing protein n=1 Tax=Aquibacillus halophilus TaxID=930132 RepID=A0A6A8D762_9BACI|nr:hypothetical protein [Aquibacillus halophilus]MRH41448.1 hypothetical protein [Aquibacillus halophilus]